ncbi:MAG TPA: single-stranded DNA-binding protein [Longimicrobium sp.]|nr:single-stranded DNA-binding protein [Longimicrobium sp.]
MARSLNKAMLIGNLGSDPEIRTTGNGTRVAQFSVATSRRWNDRSGQQQEKTEWHRIVVWDKLVEIVEKYVKKGDRLYVEGEIEYRSYEDKDGNTKYITEIRAREVVLLGSAGGGGGGDYGGGGGYRQAAGSGSGGGGGGAKRGGGGGGAAGGGGSYDDFQAPAMEDDDDLPF